MPVIKIENLEAEMKRNKISRSDIALTYLFQTEPEEEVV